MDRRGGGCPRGALWRGAEVSDREKFKAGVSWTGCAFCGASGWNTTYAELHHSEECLKKPRGPGAVISDIDTENGIITVDLPQKEPK